MKTGMALGALILVTSGASGCSKKLEATGKASIAEEKGVEVITIAIATEPKARLSWGGEKLDLGDPLIPGGEERVKYAADAIADDAGKATLRVPMWPGDEASKELKVWVERNDNSERLDLTVSATRPPSILVAGINQEALRCVGMKCKGVVDERFTVSMSELTDGTKVRMGKGPVVVAAGGNAVAPADFGELFGGDDLESIFTDQKAPPPLVLSLELPDGTKVERAIVPPRGALRRALAAMVKDPKKGVLFPGETKEQKGTGAILVPASATLHGSAKKPADIDFVAVVKEDDWTQPCGTYSTSDGERVTMNIALKHAVVTVYERRTGKQRAERTVRADATCPESYKTLKGFGEEQARKFKPEDLTRALDELAKRGVR